MGEVQHNRPIYDWITSQQIDDGYDFNISLNVVEGSPAQMQEELQAFTTFLSLVNNFPEISLSPILIREAAYKSRYRNERVISEMQRAALLNMFGNTVNQAGGLEGLAANGFNQNNANLSALQNAAPDPVSEITAQLRTQIG
jgi:hypothetical protein